MKKKQNSLFAEAIEKLSGELCDLIESVPEENERVSILNDVRRRLHDVSPFRDEPVDCVLWVKNELVEANDYNPNNVAPPEMRLLKKSIEADGYTQPIVAFESADGFEVVDGYHRNRVGKESKKVREKVRGFLPVTIIKNGRTDRRDRIAATIRHNRARGVHAVVPMIDIVVDLIREGWSDTEICTEIGMDADELLRFKQNAGLPELFKDQEYSKAWE